MENSGIGFQNCAGFQSLAWIQGYIIENFNSAWLAHASGHGSLDIYKYSLNETLQLHDAIVHSHDHHSHHIRGVSYRNP